MTVRDLIALLQEWPLDSEISVVQMPIGIGAVPSAEITRVTGFAGAAIDGHDSTTAIDVGPFIDGPVRCVDR